MSKKSKKAGKTLGKAVRKAVKRHGIATGLLTGAATAMALSGTGANRKVSEAVGNGIAGLLKVSSERAEVLQRLKKATGDALVRAGRALQSEAQAPATDAKVSTTTRRSAAARNAS